MKQQINFRASELTARQLSELAARWGTTQSETLTVCIDRICQQEMNMSMDYTPFVHEFTDASGNTRWAVGRWDAERAQYYRPLDHSEAQLTGASGEFARMPAGMQSFPTRQQALRRARTLFGPHPDDGGPRAARR